MLSGFADEHVKAAIVEGNVIDATGVLALAKLPFKDELIARMLGTLMSPGNNLVSCLQGPLRSFMYVMNAIMDKKKTEGDTGAAPQAEAVPAEEAPEAGKAPSEEPKEEDKKED